ncbi:uncharacterized protein MONBRDRAFT_18623 [Monosiga brevicollis MX1]|uniref:Myosin motor domain-containing protein n=1 Tax=Monosiga brevicollis TaxID=81824 RepID=A9UWK8_MONBE|nr:uncharacterized protein MONBRDRAFT_18623 [Monosiga brevicollis MX1]EDQ90231.1 predicted protein [Monosiga brevicollis MX1]|eukprot:XP_001744998.1 hypothetical protein [Monosiga brevicollis MX1]
MLENYTDVDVFVENLKSRFEAKLNYTYIRNILISINPFEDLGTFTSDLIDEYSNKSLFELPPHLYAIANQAYYTMKEETTDQCVLISGESGAGKTEASKQILQFLVAKSTDTGKAVMIRDRLLQSNPILEAFGNAKTTRNDNSSRFGKYLECQFDFLGEVVNGRMMTYLLEKSRVTTQLTGERNFHIFYMLLLSGDDALCRDLGLEANKLDYRYISQGGVGMVEELDDHSEFLTVMSAFQQCGIEEQERLALFRACAGILQLGEVDFQQQGDMAAVSNTDVLQMVAAAFSVDLVGLTHALTSRTVEARGESLVKHLSKDEAETTRDGLSKSIYKRMFAWLVERLNASFGQEYTEGRSTTMGLLDIYGFEVLQSNGFEQLCINYANERLQQLFVNLTLKAEQEEYEREGVAWVGVEYFDNKIICDLIEDAKSGIFAALDDTCLGPGEQGDDVFLKALDARFGQNKNALYSSWADNKKLQRDSFVLKHYAGDVAYDVAGFVSKNNDLLFRDLVRVMLDSKDTVMAKWFDESELDSKKRPPTASTQFRRSIKELMETLMVKQPSYVRCIKPNQQKHAGVWDQELVTHQVKYLGLMEVLRVARAGYCYRRPFEAFYQRYKSVCKATWPSYPGPLSEAAKLIADTLKVDESEVAVGKTKIFIKQPKTLLALENSLVLARHRLATHIQARWRGFVQRRKYLAMREAAIVCQKHARVGLAKRAVSRRRRAGQTIRTCDFIFGFMTRTQAPNGHNERFVAHVKREYLINLAKSVPNRLVKRWVRPIPPVVADTDALLRDLCRRNLALKYRLKLSPERKAILTAKLAAHELFKGRKLIYESSVPVPFDKYRVEDNEAQRIAEAFAKTSQQEEDREVLYMTVVHKMDRTNYGHVRSDVIVVTNDALHVYGHPKLKLKMRIPLTSLSKLSVSTLYDGVIVLHTPSDDKKDRGDFIFDTPHVVEFATTLFLAAKAKGVTYDVQVRGTPVTQMQRPQHHTEGLSDPHSCFPWPRAVCGCHGASAQERQSGHNCVLRWGIAVWQDKARGPSGSSGPSARNCQPHGISC